MKYTEKFWQGLGTALVILAVLWGIGGCMRISVGEPLVIIQKA